MTNVVGAQTLFDACLRQAIPRVVHIGTDEVYGSIDEGSWTEESPLQPNSPYSAAKASAELLARAYFVTHGLEHLRPRAARTTTARTSSPRRSSRCS